MFWHCDLIQKISISLFASTPVIPKRLVVGCTRAKGGGKGTGQAGSSTVTQHQENVIYFSYDTKSSCVSDKGLFLLCS